MPYDIKRNYGGCRGYAVVGNSGIHGCHTTRLTAKISRRARTSRPVGRHLDWL